MLLYSQITRTTKGIDKTQQLRCPQSSMKPFFLYNQMNQQLFYINQTSHMPKARNFLLFSILIVTLMLLPQQTTASTYYFLYYDTSNSGSSASNYSNLATYLNSNKSTCLSAPPARLNLCNNTCLNCLSTSSSKCSTCSEGYYLDGTSCVINQTNYNYSYYSYIGISKSQATSTIASLRYTSSNASLTANRVVSICQSSTYEIEVAGIFSASDAINLQFFRTDPIDQIQIKLNFVSLVETITFYVTLNDNVLFSKTYTTADLSGVYVQNSNTSDVSYLTLDALTASSASSIFLPVDTDLVSYITSQYTIKLYVKTNSTNKYAWAFNDLIVFQRDCQTCVTKAVSQLMTNTSLSVLYTLIIVIVLVIILNLAMAYEQYQRKKEFQEKLGATSGNLPHKAIDRVIEALKKAQKLREKEMNREGREYEKVKKNLQDTKKDRQSSIEEQQQSIQFLEAAKKIDSLRQV